ncbi:MAG: Sec-independent protein translocase protein TatB [Dehalococcoidales bacterium]|nr:Sec-independent protein translocase protein TatB [Dehalococcoidales bacterium]
MDFFGMGFGEILLILIIALIIWGPGKLPEIARTIGKTARALRKASTDFTSAITREIEEEEKAKPPPLPPAKGSDTKND